MKIVGILLLSTVAATAQQQPAQLFERAKQALPGRNGAHKAESLLREAFRSWDQSPNSKGIDYAQGSVLLGMILVGRNKNKEAQPLFERAIAIYDENPASTSPLDLALALELECSLVGERGAPHKERASAIRVRHIETLQGLEHNPPPPIAVYKISGNVTAPTVMYKVAPEYSFVARVAKYQGTAIVKVIVDPDGVPRDIRLLRSLGLGLDEQAFEAVKQWRFRPGMREGQPVPVYATIEVNFRLL